MLMRFQTSLQRDHSQLAPKLGTGLNISLTAFLIAHSNRSHVATTIGWIPTACTGYSSPGRTISDPEDALQKHSKSSRQELQVQLTDDV